MTSRVINPIENSYLTDKEGNLLPGGTVDFYEAGTSTPLAVYSDSALTTSLGSQITADANGLLPDFHMSAGTEYKLVGKDSGGVTKWTRDEVFSADSSTDTRLDALEASVSDLGAQGGNALINGGMRVGSGTAATLSTSFQGGVIKEWEGKVSANVTAGTLTQGESTDFASGHYLHFSGVSTSGSANVIARVQLTSDDAAKFVDAAGTFTCKVYHDIGSSTNFTATIYKADAKDNFTAITSVQAGDATAVADQTVTTVSASSNDLGDVSNGIEIQISAAVGSITTKNIRISEAKFEVGGTATGFSELPYQVARAAADYDSETSLSTLEALIPVQLATHTVSGTEASIDFATVFSDNTDYKFFRVVMEGIDGTGALQLRVSVDGSTFVSSGDYQFLRTYYQSNLTASTQSNGTAQTEITASGSITNGYIYGTIDVSAVDVSSLQAFVFKFWKNTSIVSTHPAYYDCVGCYDTLDTLTGFQLLASSNFTAGTVRVFGSNNPF